MADIIKKLRRLTQCYSPRELTSGLDAGVIHHLNLRNNKSIGIIMDKEFPQ